VLSQRRCVSLAMASRPADKGRAPLPPSPRPTSPIDDHAKGGYRPASADNNAVLPAATQASTRH
jgi:hypothetical protein